jgi:organic radical activating enzyme
MMINGFNIELTNLCTLKCAGCSRTQFINMFPQHWKNHSIDINNLMNFLDCDLTNTFISLCGTYGDPIYHPNFHNIISQFKSKGAILNIVTNGSYKTEKWWEKTGSLLDERDSVTFSVDGLPENFTIYRVNGDWKSIEVGMKVIANSKCNSIWSYIPFNYNETDIDEARDLCNQLGITQFEVNYSDRWDNHTEHLMPVNSQKGPRYNGKQSWLANKKIESITPKCADGRQHFITADGYYIPCCHISDFRFYYRTPFGSDKKRYNINTTTISKVLEDQVTIDFMSNLIDHTVCQFSCATCNA